MKTRRRRKKKNYTKFLLLFLVFILVGFLLGYWLYRNLDYQEKEYSEKEAEYQLSTPDFLGADTALFIEQDKLGIDSDIWVNPVFIEKPLDALVKSTNQGKSTNFINAAPIFRLIDLDGKQTTYRMIADLSAIKQVERVYFPVWGEKGGANDLQLNEGFFDSATNTWQSDIQVKTHGETGIYRTRLVVTKSNGKTEDVEFGEFLISQPTLEATIDPTRVTKGQFSVNIKVDSIADIEKLTTPIWSKADQSDVKWYEGQRQEDGTYKVDMDYENHNFTNGVYTTNVYLTTANGLTAEINAGTAEINMVNPTRIRLLQNAAVYQDRALTKINAKATLNSMAYVQGIVFNAEEKIYKTTEGYISNNNVQVNEMMNDVRYVAHRGNKKIAPENSIPAFQQASTWGVETDLWLTKDKQWVIMHDETVDRMTNGRGKVSDLTLEQIKGFRIYEGSNVSNYDQSQLIVPSLEEYLAIMKANQKVPFIEIKPKNLAPSDYSSLANLINYYGFSESARVISFDFNNLVEMKKQIPNLHVQLLNGVLDNQLISKMSSLGSNVGVDIEYAGALSKIDMIANAQKQGLHVNVWVVSKVDLLSALALGVDDLTINN